MRSSDHGYGAQGYEADLLGRERFSGQHGKPGLQPVHGPQDLDILLRIATLSANAMEITQLYEYTRSQLLIDEETEHEGRSTGDVPEGKAHE